MNQKDVLTLEEAADFLRICRQTLRAYVVAGRIPCRKVGRRYLFSRLALLEWLGTIDADPKRGCGRKQENL